MKKKLFALIVENGLWYKKCSIKHFIFVDGGEYSEFLNQKKKLYWNDVFLSDYVCREFKMLDN